MRFLLLFLQAASQLAQAGVWFEKPLRPNKSHMHPMSGPANCCGGVEEYSRVKNCVDEWFSPCTSDTSVECCGGEGILFMFVVDCKVLGMASCGGAIALWFLSNRRLLGFLIGRILHV